MAELDGSSSLAMHFVYAEGIAPAFLVKGTETYRILSDERGSVRLVINIADGTVAQELDYDEFGRVLTDTAPGFQPFGFAGGLYDPDTGLTRFGLRDFDAFTGRWRFRDPLGFDGGSFSLYVYVNNDPVNFVDPIGAGPWTGTAYAGFKAAVNFGANAFSFISTAAGYSAAAAKGGVVVSGFAIYQFLNSGYGMVGSGINGLAAWHGARVDNPFPETIPGLITFVASRGHPSKEAKNFSNGVNLLLTLKGLRQAAAGKLPNALDNSRIGKAVAAETRDLKNAVSVFDKTTSAWGIGPASRPKPKNPNCP